MILDCEIGILAFERNYEFLGVAFKGEYQRLQRSTSYKIDLDEFLRNLTSPGLPTNKKLYPCVSAVYGNSEIVMIYYGEPYDG